MDFLTDSYDAGVWLARGGGGEEGKGMAREPPCVLCDGVHRL